MLRCCATMSPGVLQWSRPRRNYGLSVGFGVWGLQLGRGLGLFGFKVNSPPRRALKSKARRLAWRVAGEITDVGRV